MLLVLNFTEHTNPELESTAGLCQIEDIKDHGKKKQRMNVWVSKVVSDNFIHLGSCYSAMKLENRIVCETQKIALRWLSSTISHMKQYIQQRTMCKFLV